MRIAGAAALTGLLLASYTGVLLGATANPVWNQNRKLLPAHFLTSGLGGAVGILELAGFLIPATQILGFAASGAETLHAANTGPAVPSRPAVTMPISQGRMPDSVLRLESLTAAHASRYRQTGDQ